MTKRDRMIKDWARAQRRQKQFERHQHRYNFRNEHACHDVTNYFLTGNITSGTVKIYGIEQTDPQDAA